MTKQELIELEAVLREGDCLSEEYEPFAWDPGDPPWEAALQYAQGQGFIATCRCWSSPYFYPATRMQPAERGWDNWEDKEFTSPFLTECLTFLDQLGINPEVLVV